MCVTMSQKIQDAETMCSDAHNPLYIKGIKMLKEICMNSLIDVRTRVQAYRKLLSIDINHAIDAVARFRDSIPHLPGDAQIHMVEFIRELSQLSNLDPYERITCAICVFNNRFIEYCYPMFEFLMYDPSLLITYRVEASRFLIYSEIDTYTKGVNEVLLSIIKDVSYPSEYRYNIIAGFITTTGISTIFNTAKLNVAYNEELCHNLQTAFFFNDKNGVRERILSGQHILQMDISSEENKRSVANTLLHIAKTYDASTYVVATHQPRIQPTNSNVDVKADAADVVLRLGTPEEIEQARAIIADLGRVIYDEHGNRIRDTTSIYDNMQNVHTSSVQDSVDEFIIKLINETKARGVENYAQIHSQITDFIYHYNICPEQRLKAFKAIDRISIDTATFSKCKVSSAELLVHIWHRILKYEDKEIKYTLQKRLVDELIDMNDTCSSGHSARLSNVLSGYGFDLHISFEEQVVANVKARINARIKLLSEDDQVNVAMGVMENASDDDRLAYTTFIDDVLPSIRTELADEFVDGGYIKSSDFDAYFDKAALIMR